MLEGVQCCWIVLGVGGVGECWVAIAGVRYVLGTIGEESVRGAGWC